MKSSDAKERRKVAADGKETGKPAVQLVAVLVSDADREQIEALLDEAGINHFATNVADLADGIRSTLPCSAIVDKAMLSEESVLELRTALADQPAWSNFPLILLMSRQSMLERADIIEQLGNVGVVERSLERSMLVPTVRGALQSRRRQREAGAYLRELEEAQERLRQLTENLEVRVRERTDELKAANTRLLIEIDERRHAEEQLRESEELHRYTVDLSRQLVWTAAPDGRLSSLSPRFSEITGLDRRADPHEGWLSVLHPDDYDSLLAIWSETTKAGQRNVAEFRMRVSDGSYRTFVARAAPHLNEKGEIIRWYGFTQDIEEQRRAEALLRESEELYRYTLELGRHMVWTAEPDGSIATMSHRFTEVTGKGPATPPVEVVHPDDLGHLLETWGESVRTGRRHVVEFRMRTVDGTYRLFRARGAPRRDEQGTIIRWYGHTEDIEDQHRADDARLEAEKKLRESEALYRHTLELGEQIVWRSDPDGTFRSISPRFTELTGLKNGPQRLAMHPDDIDRVMAEWNRSVLAGSRHVAEFRLRLVDGSYRTFRARSAPLRDESGAILGWYGFSEDVEDQKQAESARATAEERYRLAARATKDAIWDLDLLTNEIHWSESASETLGYPGSPLGTTPLSWWEERIHPEERREAADSLDEAVKRDKTRWSATYRFRRANGEYATFFDRGFIVRDEHGKPSRFVGAMTDLTDRQRSEEEIRRMQAELIHVSRLSAMGTMASTLAHELNQPLTAVTNYVRGSRRLLAGGDEKRVVEIQDALEAGEAAALRAGEIVRRLRELVARGNATMGPEELPKLIEEAGGIAFLDAHVLGVTPTIELDPDAQWVEVDRIQIQQVLINLIRNAFQAMQDMDTKEILITTRRRSETEVEVSVADTGGGIPPAVRDALFTAFQGTKAEGMGIGLSISRTIVEAHGGKIWAEDREGGGTVFRFTLPVWDELQPEAE